jgi:hypothetical protein
MKIKSMMRTGSTILAMALMATMGSTGASAAVADPAAEPVLTPELAAQLDARAEMLGITDEVKDSLIEKYLDGEELDSASGADPVSSSTYVEQGFEVTRNEYADGSISLNSAQIPHFEPAEGYGTRSVTQCVKYQGVGYFPFENCLIETTQLFYSQSFRMDGFNGSSGTFYGGITSVYDLDYVAVGVAVTGTSLTIIKANQNASGPAKATGTVYWSTIGGSGQNRVSGYVNYGSIYDTAP